jgi:hypothetical protein
MPERRTVRHLIIPVPERRKMSMPEPVRYRKKETQSDTEILRYRTELLNAGLLMPAASASMPVPSYGTFPAYNPSLKIPVQRPIPKRNMDTKKVPVWLKSHLLGLKSRLFRPKR